MPAVRVNAVREQPDTALRFCAAGRCGHCENHYPKERQETSTECFDHVVRAGDDNSTSIKHRRFDRWVMGCRSLNHVHKYDRIMCVINRRSVP